MSKFQNMPRLKGPLQRRKNGGFAIPTCKESKHYITVAFLLGKRRRTMMFLDSRSELKRLPIEVLEPSHVSGLLTSPRPPIRFDPQSPGDDHPDSGSRISFEPHHAPHTRVWCGCPSKPSYIETELGALIRPIQTASPRMSTPLPSFATFVSFALPRCGLSVF